NTVMMGEKAMGGDHRRIRGGIVEAGSAWSGDYPDAVNPSICLTERGQNGNYREGSTVHGWNAHRWTDGATNYQGFSTILAPNSPSCSRDGWDGKEGVISASSYHPGGANSLFGDGSVSFVTETIDTGDLSRSPVGSGASPYG